MYVYTNKLKSHSFYSFPSGYLMLEFIRNTDGISFNNNNKKNNYTE